MWSPRLAAMLATLLLVTAALAPPAMAESPLAIEVVQDADGSATVTVTHDGSPVVDANVTVDAPNATYAGEGEYETDANGTVELPAPGEDLTVDVTADDGSQTGSTTVELSAPGLDVSVEQAADGNATVTVTNTVTDVAVPNASVNVTTVDENATYAGTGDYETDDNGTVDLPAPAESVEVAVTAEDGDLAGSTTVTLLAPSLAVVVVQDEAGNATVTVTNAITDEAVAGASVNVTTVDENATYAGSGDYETDENGTVDLPAPAEEVEVEVTAVDGDLSGSTTVTLLPAGEQPGDGEALPFGARVVAVVQSLLGDRGDGHPGIGRALSAWVLENNPGNPPEHAGPPADAGPPDHAGPPGDDDADADAANASTSGPADEEDADRGPPDHAGPPDDRGNGGAKGR